MSDAQKRLDEYEAKPTAELIENAEQLIYAMCKDGSAKHWRMSVPVSPGDSDIILTAALNSAKQQIADLQRQLDEAKRREGLLLDFALAAQLYISKSVGDPDVFPDTYAAWCDYLVKMQAAIDGGALEGGDDG